MIAFKFSQTFLITAAISYLETPIKQRNQNHAYGLIGATAFIYIGKSVCSIIPRSLTHSHHLSQFSGVLFYHQAFRMTTYLRGYLSTLIYNKSLSTKLDGKRMEAVSLMSNDTDRLIGSLLQVSEIWAQIVEVGLGTWLLWRQMGVVSIAPLLIVLLCFGGQSFVSRFMPKRQASWMEAIARRVKVTSNILRYMKSVKLAGLEETSAKLLQGERIREINVGKSSRWMMVWQNAVGKIFQIGTAIEESTALIIHVS
jgi:ATP-binding cassette subfamily C (CFTR/MRP) protein 1